MQWLEGLGHGPFRGGGAVKATRFLLAGLLMASVGIALTPQAAAIGNCDTYQTIKVTGLLSVTDVQVCGTPAYSEFGEVGDTVPMSMRVSMPNVASTPTITLTAGTPVGCTAGTATTRTVSGTNGGATSYFNTFTTTDSTCVFSVRVQIVISTTAVFDNDFAFEFQCNCNEAISITSWPSLSTSITSWPTLNVAGELTTSDETTALSRVTDGTYVMYAFPRLLSIPETGTALTFSTWAIGPADGTFSTGSTPSVSTDGTCTWNSLGTGSSTTQINGDHVSRSQASVTMAVGTNFCQITGNVFLTVASATRLVQPFNIIITRDAGAMSGDLALSGAVTVTDDANGWAIDVLDDTTNDGQLTVPVGSVMVGNASQNVTFPSTLSVEASFPGSVENPGLDFWMLTLFWVAALLFFLYQKWLFAAGFAIPGLLDSLFPSQIPNDFSVYFVLCLLGLVMEVAANKFQWAHWKSRNGAVNPQ